MDGKWQWSSGAVPRIECGQEYGTAYDVTQLASKPGAGKAGIEAFYASRGNGLFAIPQRWPGGNFKVKDASGVNQHRRRLIEPCGLGVLEFSPK